MWEEAWEKLLHKENRRGRKAKTEGLFEKMQKDLKSGNCLVMAKITFCLCNVLWEETLSSAAFRS